MATYETTGVHTGRGILPTFSWSAAIAGALIALVTYIALMILGGAIGLSVLTFDQQIQLSAAGWSTGIWWVLFSTISVGFGAFIAGRLSGTTSKFAGAMNGLLVWALLSVANISFTTSTIQSLASGAGKVMNKAGDAVSSGLAGLDKIDIEGNVGEMIGIENMDQLKREIDRIDAPEVKQIINTEYDKLTTTIKRAAVAMVQNPDKVQSELKVVEDQLKSSVNRLDQDLSQEKIEQIVANNSSMSQAQVAQTAENWKRELTTLANDVERNLPQFEERVEEFADEAATKADNVADGISTFMAIVFVLFLIGFIVSIIFGTMGTKSTYKRNYIRS